MTASLLESQKNTIIGNTVLYGATAGSLYAAGQAGERFCVRNSGALAVIEGCGSNGCEYMTGGMVAILGTVGSNFAAGMSGGMAFVYDPSGLLPQRINPDSVIYHRLEVAYWEEALKDLIADHAKETQSRFAAQLLNDWMQERGKFWQVVPKDMISRLDVATRKPEAAEERA
jgi:glutamate synthase (NADPH/NADH) large chain